MKTCLIIFIAFIWTHEAISQTAQVSADSSQIVFPSSVTIRLSRLPSRQTEFIMTSYNLKVLMVEINFLLNRLQLEQKNVVYFRKNEEVLKSMVAMTEKKYLSELQRTLLHKEAFEKLERVATSSNAELDKCRIDLEQISQEQQSGKKRGFVRGLIWGTIAGGVLGILIDASLR